MAVSERDGSLRENFRVRLSGTCVCGRAFQADREVWVRLGERSLTEMLAYGHRALLDNCSCGKPLHGQPVSMLCGALDDATGAWVIGRISAHADVTSPPLLCDRWHEDALAPGDALEEWSELALSRAKGIVLSPKAAWAEAAMAVALDSGLERVQLSPGVCLVLGDDDVSVAPGDFCWPLRGRSYSPLPASLHGHAHVTMTREAILRAWVEAVAAEGLAWEPHGEDMGVRAWDPAFPALYIPVSLDVVAHASADAGVRLDAWILGKVKLVSRSVRLRVRTVREAVAELSADTWRISADGRGLHVHGSDGKRCYIDVAALSEVTDADARAAVIRAIGAS